MIRKNTLKFEYLKVEDDFTHCTYFGGNQEWFKTKWRRMSGCGPTTGSTIVMYEDIKNNIDNKKYTKSQFLDLMNDMWQFITPKVGRGVNTIELFYNGFEKYIEENQERNIKTTFMKIPKEFNERPSNTDVFKFLYKALDNDHPIAFLNLDNGDETKLDAWHWVTIVGILYDDIEDKLQVTIADEGLLKMIDLGLWLNTTKNEGGFIYFE
ncbi:hypothetical protein [Intestinibacter sp.]